MNRNNRSAHESHNYGFFVYSHEILDSNIKDILEQIQLAILIY